MRILLSRDVDIVEKVKRDIPNHIPYSVSYANDNSLDAIIAYVCPNCGAELFGLWKTWYLSVKWGKNIECNDEDKALVGKYEKELRNSFSKEAIDILNLKNCPICSEALSHEKGFYLEIATRTTDSKYGLNFNKLANNKLITKTSTSYSYQTPSYGTFEYTHSKGEETLFAYIKKQRDEEGKEIINQKINSKIASLNTPSVFSISDDNKNSIKNSSEKLKEYLLTVIKTELNIYSLTERLTSLYIQENEIKWQANFSNALPLYETKKKLNDTQYLLNEHLATLSRYEKGNIGISEPEKPEEPEYQKPGLFNKKKILGENAALEALYNAELQKYEEKKRSFETQKSRMIASVKKEIEDLKNAANSLKEEIENVQVESSISPASEFKNIFDREIFDAEALLKKLFECRNNLYSYEIIFDKYRNAVALSTFYEYLTSGRCTELEGPYGAYNIYENEVRANMIIDKLNTVIDKLDKIKDTQYMIYSQLQTVNQNLAHLNSTMDAALVSIKNMDGSLTQISKNTEVIAHNTAVTAYYSKLNAELTNSLGYLVTFK